ncbi:hypothetical protein [Sphingomonas rubra]|nr:hypothetical protein [Sphingomonas rubra]
MAATSRSSIMAPSFLLILSTLVPAMMAIMPGGVVQRWTIHERVVIRVPRTEAGPASPVRWRERKAPRCLKLTEVSAATIAAPASVDLLMSDGRRIRARLEGECRSAGFYSGFYVRPGSDGMLCADRDVIRIRSGAACAIDRFRLLTQRR